MVVGVLRRELKIPVSGRWEEKIIVFVLVLKSEQKLQLGNNKEYLGLFRILKLLFSSIYKGIKYIRL